MKHKQILLTLTAAAVAAMMFGRVDAEERHPCPAEKMRDGHGRPPHCRMWIEELNLTKDQKEKLKALRQEMQPLREKHMESIKAVKDKIKAELEKPNLSEGILYGYAGEMGELHKQMAKDRIDHLLKVKKILSPEQFSKLIEMEDRPMWGKPFGPHGKIRCPHPHPEECPFKDGDGAGKK